MNQQHLVFFGPPAGTFGPMLVRAWAGIQAVLTFDTSSKGTLQVIRDDE